jgi:hypothetical protein
MKVAIVCVAVVASLASPTPAAEDAAAHQKATIDGSEPGWRPLAEGDFVNVNCAPDTWSWTDGRVHCTGKPVGVIRSQKTYANFELLAQWQHLASGGNSGIFVWTPEQSLKDLAPGRLPEGIEVQVLDNGFTEKYEKQTGKKADWFTTHGDVFPVGSSMMKPFPPVAPDGKRSLPTRHVSKGVGQWNHYYVRAINGEVRLWVNGQEVSGGSECNPRSGYLCLESEGSPVEFRQLRIRELP